jgi:hypothetical protein
MALKPCKEYKKEVSTGAKTCPYCGVKNPTISTKDVVIGAVVSIILCLVLIQVFSSGGDKQESSAQVKNSVAEPIAKTTAVPEKKTLGIKPDEFRKRYNSIAQQVDKKYAMGYIQAKKGAFDTTVANAVGFGGTIDEDSGLIKEILMIIGKNDKDPMASIIVLLSATTAMHEALNPTIPKEVHAKVVSDMLARMGDGLNKTPIKETIGKLRYSVSKVEGMGVWFVISPT